MAQLHRPRGCEVVLSKGSLPSPRCQCAAAAAAAAGTVRHERLQSEQHRRSSHEQGSDVIGSLPRNNLNLTTALNPHWSIISSLEKERPNGTQSCSWSPEDGDWYWHHHRLSDTTFVWHRLHVIFRVSYSSHIYTVAKKNKNTFN